MFFEKKSALSDLMLKAQNGDKKAYEKLLNKISPMIEAYLNKRIFDKDAIPDITQTCLLAIHKSRHTFRPTQPFENWMYGLVKFKMIDYLRKNYRKGENEVVDTESLETFAQDETNTNKAEIQSDLKTLLNHLPQKQRRLITLLKIQGHSVSDVARQLDMSEANVKVSMHRALKTLQDIAENDMKASEKNKSKLKHKTAR